MQKNNVILKSMAISLFAGLAASSANAVDWSVTKSVAPYTLRVSASSCFDEPDKTKVSFDWTQSLSGYDKINASSECDCGQSLELNEELVISRSSLIDLISKDFPLALSSYKCTGE